MTHISAQEEFIWAMRARQEAMAREEMEASKSKKTKETKPRSLLDDRKAEIMASLVPDEIICNVDDYTPRHYTACLLFGDVSGFTELCERYNQIGKGGPSRLTMVLNRYIGALVQEVMSFGGDVLKFSGDAFLAMWKCKDEHSILRDFIHMAIDCALVIQKNYATYETDVGIFLKVKLAISAGPIVYSIIGDYKLSHYVVVGQPIADAKEAEHKSSPGEIILSNSAWYHVNAADYITEVLDGTLHRVLGLGPNWRHATKNTRYNTSISVSAAMEGSDDDDSKTSASEDTEVIPKRVEEFSLRPIMHEAFKLQDYLRRFIIGPVLRCIDSDEPIEYLTEMRHVVITFINVVPKKCSNLEIVKVVDAAYKIICKYAAEFKGCLNKVSLFDKDIMLVVIFGLRGFKDDLECQNALRFSAKGFKSLQSMDNVSSVSIACTTGKTYCGVVGHTLRREYTVISLIVNKAARLMVNYPGKVTCDLQTFQQSKMEAKHFILQEFKTLKGISKPGPVYEFKELELEIPDLRLSNPYPILGRDQEIKDFLTLLTDWLDKKNDCSKKMLVIQGDIRQGKTRLLEECVYRTKQILPTIRLCLRASDKKNRHGSLRNIFYSALELDGQHKKQDRQAALRLKLRQLKKVDLLCSLNIMFKVEFPMTKLFKSYSKTEKHVAGLKILKQLCYACFKEPLVIAIDNVHYMDEATWKLMPILLDIDTLFVVLTVQRHSILCPSAKSLLAQRIVVNISLPSIGQLFHAGLACQILDVYAIPAELENAIQSKSNGNPGWIETFMISLLQSTALKIKKACMKDIHKYGLVMPPLYMTHRLSAEQTGKWRNLMEEKSEALRDDVIDEWHVYIDSCRDAETNVIVRGKIHQLFLGESLMPVCILSDDYYIREIDPEASRDIDMLKTFDSLTYHEQLLLKCSSVLGDTFPRTMLSYVMISNSPRRTATAVKQLFEKRVLCCAKGDFSEGGNYLIIRDKIVDPSKNLQIECNCVALQINEFCEDLPKYASCGFLRFRSSVFRLTTYDLLTDAQKKEFHARAAKYLIKETRRCTACGGNYIDLTSNIGRLDEINERYARRRKANISMVKFYDDPSQYTRSISISGGSIASSQRFSMSSRRSTLTKLDYDIDVDLTDEHHRGKMGLIGPRTLFNLSQVHSLTKTFSTSDFQSCACHLIMCTLYNQLTNHYRGAGQWLPMVDAMIRYARICIENGNYSKARIIVSQALTFLETSGDTLGVPSWYVPLYAATCHNLYGLIQIHTEESQEAYKTFLLAMTEFGHPFPTCRIDLFTKLWRKKLKQKLSLYFYPEALYNKNMSLFETLIVDNMSECLCNLCDILMKENKWKLAELAGIWSLNCSLEAQSNLITICNAFANMLLIAQARQKSYFSLVLEVHALRICHKRSHGIERSELAAVGHLYYIILSGRFARAEFDKALHIGYICTRITITVNKLNLTTHTLAVIIVALLTKLYIAETISLIQELEFYAEESEEGKTWYYSICLTFHLETGYTFVPFSACELYYHSICANNFKNFNVEVPFLVKIWTWYLRNEKWEAAAICHKTLEQFNIYGAYADENTFVLLVYYLEGLLLNLVHKMNRRNIYELFDLKQQIGSIIKYFKLRRKYTVCMIPRFHILQAYHALILDNQEGTEKHLKQAKKEADKVGNEHTAEFAKHVEMAWKNQLPAATLNFWKKHCQPNENLDYHELTDNVKLGYFSYPLPLFY